MERMERELAEKDLAISDLKTVRDELIELT